MKARNNSRRLVFAFALLAVAVLPTLSAHSQEIATLKPENAGNIQNQPTCLAFSPDGKLLVMGNSGGPVAVWDLEKKRERYQLPDSKGAYVVAFSADGKHMVALSGVGRKVDGKIKVWDTTSKEAKDGFGDTTYVTAVAFTPDGKTLVSAGTEGGMKLWDFATRKELRKFKGDDDPQQQLHYYNNIAVSPDGKRFAGSLVFGNNKIDVFDDVGKVVLTYKQEGAGAVAFSPDSKLLAMSSRDVIKIMNLGTKEVDAELKVKNGARKLMFTPKGTLISAGYDGIITLWDVKEEKEIGVLKGHEVGVTAMALSKDGTILASADSRGVVKLWDVAKAMK